METRVVNIKSGKSYDVYIGRGKDSTWGNPYTHIKTGKTTAEFVVATRKEAVERYRQHLLNSPELMEKLESLRGKTLGCWCINSDEYIPGETPLRCHGQIIQILLDYPDRLYLPVDKLF